MPVRELDGWYRPAAKAVSDAATIDAEELVQRYRLDPDLGPLIERAIRWLLEGAPTDTTVPPTDPERAARDDLLTKATNALASNADFLALANPTNAQNAAQLKAVTRQVNGLIKLTLGDLDDTTGT